jgi:hypothetical protein
MSGDLSRLTCFFDVSLKVDTSKGKKSPPTDKSPGNIAAGSKTHN